MISQPAPQENSESRSGSHPTTRSIARSTPSISELQTDWHGLLDPDRARAILALHKSRVSYRKLAGALNCKESLLRHLVKMLDAEPEDLELAQHALISTNECVRRGEQANARREAARLQAIERKRVAKVDRVTRTILHWLKSDNATGRNAEQIVEDARFNLILAEQTNGLPSRLPPIGMNVSEIIEWARPTKQSADELDISWFGGWLVNWVVGALPKRSSHWEALDQALSQVSSRSW
jgi:hypothetical protein